MWSGGFNRSGSFIVFQKHQKHDMGQSMTASLDLQAGPNAFGDGAHPSTQGMLLALEALAPLRGIRQALDMGCGSGILALKAAYQWHCRVIAVDKEALAVAATQENAQTNQLDALIFALQGDTPSHPRVLAAAPYDIIMANMLAEPLLAMASPLASLLSDEGVLLISGILRWQSATLEEAYGSLGLTLLQRYLVGDWTTLLWQRQ